MKLLIISTILLISSSLNLDFTEECIKMQDKYNWLQLQQVIMRDDNSWAGCELTDGDVNPNNWYRLK